MTFVGLWWWCVVGLHMMCREIEFVNLIMGQVLFDVVVV